MAKDRNYSSYQKGIIKRFYEHRETLALQKLAETVSDLYLETSDSKRSRAWRAAHSQMLAAGIHPHQADAIFADQDLGALARLVAELT